MGATLTIDTESEAGAWAEALRWPNSITIIEAGTPGPVQPDGGGAHPANPGPAAVLSDPSHTQKLPE